MLWGNVDAHVRDAACGCALGGEGGNVEAVDVDGAELIGGLGVAGEEKGEEGEGDCRGLMGEDEHVWHGGGEEVVVGWGGEGCEGCVVEVEVGDWERGGGGELLELERG